MKFKAKRDDEPQEVTAVTMYIGLERYRLTESKDGKLNIIKFSDGESDLIKIFPRAGNEIELN